MLPEGVSMQDIKSSRLKVMPTFLDFRIEASHTFLRRLSLTVRKQRALLVLEMRSSSCPRAASIPPAPLELRNLLLLQFALVLQSLELNSLLTLPLHRRHKDLLQVVTTFAHGVNGGGSPVHRGNLNYL